MNAVIDPKEFDAAQAAAAKAAAAADPYTYTRSPLTMRASTTNPSRSTGAS